VTQQALMTEVKAIHADVEMVSERLKTGSNTRQFIKYTNLVRELETLFRSIKQVTTDRIRSMGIYCIVQPNASA
jgi:hypothetical protein